MSKRSNYEEISSLNIKLLFTLQNKFALSTRKQIDFENLNFVSNIATNIQLIEKNNARARNRCEMLENLNSLFQLMKVQIVIFKKKIRNIFEKFYEKSQKSMKSLIKKFQINDKIVKKFVEKSKKSFRRRRNKFY